MITPVNPITQPTPNVVLIPSIILSTKVINGKLVTSANIQFQAGYYDGNNFQTVGGAKSCVISDCSNLDTDLAALATDVTNLETSIITIMGEINAIRHYI